MLLSKSRKHLIAIFAAAIAAACACPCVAQSSVQVTVGTSPAGPAFTVDGTQYTSVQTFTWSVGGTHTLAASSPQIASSTEYTFSSWSDGGAVSHTVSASSTTTSYTASFNTSYELTIATNNSHGTAKPASGSYYASGSQVAITATPNSSYYFSDWTGSSDVAADSKASTTIAMNGPESITANFNKASGIQYLAVVYVVTTAMDDSVGVAANCPLGGPFGNTGMNCTLRDALEAASESDGANIYFDSAVFAATNTATQNTIVLSYGPLSIPSSTIVGAPTAPNGRTFSNVVTVSGNSVSQLFWVASGVSHAEIDNLNMVNGSGAFGGAIYTDGELTVAGSTIANSAAAGSEGGGVYIDANGSLLLEASTLSGNSASKGAGIAAYGKLTASECTFDGNQADTLGGGLYIYGSAAIANCTVSGNHALPSGTGGGIAVASGGRLKLANSIVSGNNSGAPLPDLEGNYTDGGGNVVAAGEMNLAILGNYGGQTQSRIPLPWTPAICAGLAANVSSIVSTDQRGLPNMNTSYPGYSVASPCIDSGAVQTDYSLGFTAGPAPVSPATSILTGTSFSAAVTLNESGAPFSVPVTIPLSLNGNGSLSGGSAATVNGVATYAALQVSAAGQGDILTASLPLNPPLSPFPLEIATTSSPFDVLAVATTTSASNATAPFSSTAQSIALSADVLSSSMTVNAGTITFTLLSGSAPVGSPATSATLTNGVASANYILPAATPPGTYTIHAVYNAGGAFTASSDSAHTLTVSQATSTATLSSSTGNANLNANVTFTAMVTGSATIAPTGSVNFYDGSNLLGAGTLNAQGVAAYTTSSLAAGIHLMTAVYSGDSDFAGSTSAQYAQTVTAPDYSLSVNPASLSLQPGQTGQVTFTFAPVGGFTGAVNFACTGLPQPSTCSFAPASLTANGSNTTQTTIMTIATDGPGTGNVAHNRERPSPSDPQQARLLLLPALVLGAFLGWRRKRIARRYWLSLALLAAALAGISACGSSSPITAAGTYTVVVTASASSGGQGTHTVAFTLIVTN